jgi:hypothetical protein
VPRNEAATPTVPEGQSNAARREGVEVQVAHNALVRRDRQVGGDDCRAAAGKVTAEQRFEHRQPARIERGTRLIHQPQRPICGTQRDRKACQIEPLLLTLRQASGVDMPLTCEADLVERSLEDRPGVIGGQTAIERGRQRKVFDGGQLAFGAMGMALIEGLFAQLTRQDRRIGGPGKQLPARQRRQAEQGSQQAALARAIGAQEPQQFAGRQAERQIDEERALTPDERERGCLEATE